MLSAREQLSCRFVVRNENDLTRKNVEFLRLARQRICLHNHIVIPNVSL